MKNYLDPKTNMPIFLGLLVTLVTQLIDQLFIWLNQYLPDAIEVTLKQVVVVGLGMLFGFLVQKIGTIPQTTYERDLAEAKVYKSLKEVNPHS